ncbi:MAG TPA: hypothetical protein VIG06_00845 [Kofleriaceae bacterium]|jgi:hypothetical protein
MKTAVMLVAVAMLAGCSKREDRTQDTGHRTQDTGHGTIDGRTQRDLAAEIAGAEKLRRDEADAEYGRIRKSWLGKRVSWKVDVMSALCRSADECHALPFDRLGTDRTVVQGWMPRLRLDPATFAGLQARCAGRARCPVTVEATVADFTLSTEEPTSLTLAGVSFDI